MAKETHTFSNGVEVTVTDEQVKVFAGSQQHLEHKDLSKKYFHAAVFLQLKTR